MIKEDITNEQEKVKLEILKLELEQNKGKNKKGLKIDPVLATIFVALIGFLGTTIVSMYNSINEKDLKQREFEFELIKISLQRPTQEERTDLLEFINKLKLIKDKEVSASLDSALLNPESIPSLSSNEMIFKNDPIKVDPEFKSSSESISALALKAAIKYIGASEDSLYNNSGIDISNFIRGGQGIPWSCSFVCWCFSQNQTGSPPFEFTYSWMSLKNELEKKNMYRTDISDIKSGDIYFLKTNYGIGHGGIVEKVQGDSITGIEGNVNNKVARSTRDLTKIVGIGRVE